MLPLVLFCISFLDMSFTAWGLQSGSVTEANPFMDYFLQKGGIAFLFIVKISITLWGIAVLETIAVVWPSYKGTVRTAYKTTIILYITIFFFATIILSTV